MLTAILLAQAAQNPDLRFMQQAVYLASSPIADPTAPGGFGTTDNLPRSVTDKSLLANGARATLRKVDGGFTVHLTNGGRADVWFEAADSNVMAWLEAKDVQGNWRPIQWKHWYTCGNSFHRVALTSGYGWSWRVEMPSGLFTTKVRWRASWNKSETISNEIEVGIPPQRFSLGDELAKTHVVDMKYAYPMLRDKGSGF